MAYLTHNAYRSYGRSRLKPHAAAAIASWVVALAVIAFVGVAGFRASSHTATTPAVSVKGDRVMAVVASNMSDVRVLGSSMVDGDGRVVMQRDEARRTTIVSRDATIPLTEGSPFPRGGR